MGAGKSTVGRLLAASLGVRFIDVDELVASQAGASIAEIFARQGEQVFREMERSCLERLAASSEPAVVAAGGGAPMAEANRPFFRDRAVTFYLSVPFEELAARTARDRSRPLRSRPLEELRLLYESRVPVYRELGSPIAAGEGRRPREVAESILRALGEPGRAAG